jgi:hypothetical protein
MACPFNSSPPDPFACRLALPARLARTGNRASPSNPTTRTCGRYQFRPSDAHTQRTNLANSHWGRTAVQEQPTLERSAHLPWDYFPLPLIHPERRTQEILADKVR